MVSVKDVADVIKMLGDVVKSTREIINAVNDGRKYLALKYPDAQRDFSSLIDQMQKAIEGMAKVTSVITNFRFVIAGNVDDSTIAYSELARFNDYIISQKADVAVLRNVARKLKADCGKVRTLRDKLDERTKERSWGSLFGLLGDKAQQRTVELHSTISNFYADDERMIELINQTLDLAESAIKDIEYVLGPAGVANPYNVPEAATILGIYAKLFEAPNKDLQHLANIMSEAQSALIIG
ncbi:hypothetical protein FRZ67_19205 [Panacibacter ginsenosidivorans]|uniref:Uncharacterized protein n=1 Tax=Panacibacter ginsenosidivorans TaxID=1813871 RepID=A0A5B8VDE0_9BACT|nr:hypothetical protein [Panacibacter ginsenosidivorans]QEC69332.1 hypothetical protein FRZ67_19205 [Panacibacter ginsenosidivorans]